MEIDFLIKDLEFGEFKKKIYNEDCFDKKILLNKYIYDNMKDDEKILLILEIKKNFKRRDENYESFCD